MARLLFYTVSLLALLVASEGVETTSNRGRITDETGFYELPADMQFYIRMMFKKKSVLETDPAMYWKLLGPLRMCMYQVEYEDAVTKYLLKRWSSEDIKINRRNGKMMSVEMPHSWYVLLDTRAARYLACLREHTDTTDLAAFSASWTTWKVLQAEESKDKENPQIVEDIDAEIDPKVQNVSTTGTGLMNSPAIYEKTADIRASIATLGSSLLNRNAGNGTQSPLEIVKALPLRSALPFWKKGDPPGTDTKVEQEAAPSSNDNNQQPIISLPATPNTNKPLPDNSQKAASTTPREKEKQLVVPATTNDKPIQNAADNNEKKTEGVSDVLANLWNRVNTYPSIAAAKEKTLVAPNMTTDGTAKNEADNTKQDIKQETMAEKAARMLDSVNNHPAVVATAGKAAEMKNKASENLNTGFDWRKAIPTIFTVGNTTQPQ